MNREGFLEAIRRQLADEIQEAFRECSHLVGKQIDFPKLNTMIKKLQKTAKVEGLPEGEFKDLVKSFLPDLCSRLEIFQDRSSKKKAA